MREDTPCGIALLESRRDAWRPLAPSRWRAANDDVQRLDVSRVLRAIKRFFVSPDSLLSTEEVIECIGGRSADCRRWLKQNVPVFPHPTDRRVYRWGDVLDAMRRAA